MADGRIRNLALWLQGWFAGWRDTPDWWTVILTAAMVVLTTLTFIVAVGTLIIFYGQFREMQTQTTILNCQARQAASDSKEAQKNFERQLQEAKAQTGAVLRVMRIDQRPWLSVTPAPPSQKLNGIPDEINADVVLANLGKTAALNVRSVFYVRHLMIGKEPQLVPNTVPPVDPAKIHPADKSEVGALFPNQTRQLDIEAVEQKPGHGKLIDHFSMKSSSLDNLIYMVVYGRVTYTDGFGAQHWTNYCNAIISTLKPPSNITGSPSKRCVEYNGADHNDKVAHVGR